MPPPTCNKCRSAIAAEGDAWCLGCSGWEAIGRELSASWDSSGARLLAGDLVINTCRQVRALRSLSAGLARQGDPPAAGRSRAAGRESTREGADHRSSLPRRRSHEPPEPKEEQESEEEEDGESDEEEEDRERRHRSRTPVRRSRGGDKRPPEPDNPPPGASTLPRPLSRAEPVSADKRRSDKRSSGKRDDRGRSRRGGDRGRRRAGRKHKRLHRLAKDPTKVIHRALGGSFLELSSLQPGVAELGHLGR